MDECDIALARSMGMRVWFIGSPVGCPASVCNPAITGRTGIADCFLERCEFTGPFDDLDTAPVQERESGRILSPVLEPFQTLEQNRCGLFGADIAYDSAHEVSPSSSSGRIHKRLHHPF